MIEPGYYRHFKGNLYEVIGVGIHSETGEKLVVYRACYGEGGLWLRPYEMFEEVVEWEGKQVARFRRIVEEARDL